MYASMCVGVCGIYVCDLYIYRNNYVIRVFGACGETRESFKTTMDILYIYIWLCGIPVEHEEKAVVYTKQHKINHFFFKVIEANGRWYSSSSSNNVICACAL